MKLRLLSSFFIFIIFSAQPILFAQNESILLTVKVVENETRNPLEFVTVLVKDSTTGETIAGTTTTADGSFEVMAAHQDVQVEFSFIGFETWKITEFTLTEGKADLGVIKLVENNVTLDEVEIRAEKSQTEFRLDKRVFNVGKDLSSTGASALEVLNNVPSVNVNIEGQISLRGSNGVQILINGKPSVLASEQGNALGTITADMIDRIEVITNPSAKYDAEGTSGIINIVIKKEERKGINGSVSLNTGVPHNHSFGLSMNRRTEKFNLFSQLGVGYRELPSDNENINRDLTTNNEIYSIGTEYRNETFYNVILGTDYHINSTNVLTLSGNFAYEIEDQPSETNFSFIDETGTTVSEWARTEVTEATNPKWQYELQYKSDFKDDEDHMLLFSALGNFFGKAQSSEFTNTSIKGDGLNGNQRTRTDFQEARYTFKLDYTKPFTSNLTLETGAQYVFMDVNNDFEVTDLVSGEWMIDMNQTNVFVYDQGVAGVYSTGAWEGDKWGLKLGLRLENTNLNTLLENTGQANNQNYTNLFPSVHSSYKITETFSVQGGYSRRIFRPRMWDLNPFFNIRNNFSIRTGNPDLLPEFTDSYEVMSIYALTDISFNFGVFHRYTTDVVERISTFSEGINTTMPFNIGTNRSTGIEFNTKYSPSKVLTFNGDFNYLIFTRQGTLENTDFNFTSDQWSAKLNAKIKLPADIDTELTGHYQSRLKTVQSEVSANMFLDFGFRKKILKGKAVVNLSVRDVFASRFRESNIYQPSFYLYSRSQRGRFITMGFSYGFGKGEAMEYSGQRRHH